MAIYSECPNCGASLDPGEHCDCECEDEEQNITDPLFTQTAKQKSSFSEKLSKYRRSL